MTSRRSIDASSFGDTTKTYLITDVKFSLGHEKPLLPDADEVVRQRLGIEEGEELISWAIRDAEGNVRFVSK